MYLFKQEQLVSADLGRAWDFFSAPNNLAQLTPPSMGFKVLDPTAGSIYTGMLIRYKVSPLLGISINWSSVISSVQKEHFFVDDQVEGPFKTWHHEHHFKSVGANQTLITDKLYYQLPFGAIGKLFHPVLVRNKLREIFLYRQKRITEIFGS